MARIASGPTSLSRKVENTALATLLTDISTIGNWCQCVSGQISATGRYYDKGRKIL